MSVGIFTPKKNSHKSIWIGLLLACAIPFMGFSQEQAEGPQTLQEQYKQLMDKSETYQYYKVIPISKLNNLWGQVKDSLNTQKTTIHQKSRQIVSLQQRIDTLKSKLESTHKALDASEARNDQIDFLGISFSKTAYNILVWVIIIGLVIGLVFLFLAFQRSFRVTRNTKKDLDRVQEEFEEFRKKTNDKKIKLKRELQTALNKLEEIENKRPR